MPNRHVEWPINIFLSFSPPTIADSVSRVGPGTTTILGQVTVKVENKLLFGCLPGLGPNDPGNS